MPSTERKVGEIQGSQKYEMYDIYIETDAGGKVPQYVYVRKRDGGTLVTSFSFDKPTRNCNISLAAAQVAGCPIAKEETTEQDEVIDWDETYDMQSKIWKPDQTNWPQRPS